jgi:hypothetical protein
LHETGISFGYGKSQSGTHVATPTRGKLSVLDCAQVDSGISRMGPLRHASERVQ